MNELNQGHFGSLNIIENNNLYTIYGGSCHEPKGIFDLYISLDTNQPIYDWEYPWIKTSQKHIRMPIEDYFIPQNYEKFNSVVEYAKEQLEKGLKIHVGCIGGKGRTGLFLSALYQKFNKYNSDINAIEYVRENYNSKAVETIAQIFFLKYNYKIEVPKVNKLEYDMFIQILEDNLQMSLEQIIKKYKNTDSLYEDIELCEYFIMNSINQSNKKSKNYLK